MRDSQILDLLLAGHPKTLITEVGVQRGMWRAADVERVAAAHAIGEAIARETVAEAVTTAVAEARHTGNTDTWTPPEPPAVKPVVLITPRLVDILDCLCDGLSNRQMGDKLHLTEDTVKTHMRHLMTAFGARDRAHVVALASAGRVEVRVVNRNGRKRPKKAAGAVA